MAYNRYIKGKHGQNPNFFRILSFSLRACQFHEIIELLVSRGYMSSQVCCGYIHSEFVPTVLG